MTTNQLLHDYEREALYQYRAQQAKQQNASYHQPGNAWEALIAWLARLDWHKVFIWTARLTVAGFVGYAGYKLVNVWLIYPDWRFLAFIDMHTPLMLFSGVFVFFFLHHKDSERMGIIALLSTVLNALLV